LEIEQPRATSITNFVERKGKAKSRVTGRRKATGPVPKETGQQGCLFERVTRLFLAAKKNFIEVFESRDMPWILLFLGTRHVD